MPNGLLLFDTGEVSVGEKSRELSAISDVVEVVGGAKAERGGVERKRRCGERQD